MPRDSRGLAFFAAVVPLLFLAPPALSFQSDSNQPVELKARARSTPVKSAPGNDQAGAHLRVDLSLALIPVHVTTQAGNPVMMLSKDNFRVYEEGVEQTISYFAQDDAPLSVGLVFDSSGSMSAKRQKASEAAAAFFQTATSQDEFFLVEFDDRPNFLVPFTPDSKAVYNRILRTRPFGRTSLLDAIHLALTHMKEAHNPRKAIVILSDGGDNRSRHTYLQIKNELLESDVQLYAMGLFNADDLRKSAPEEVNGPRLLDDLARESGGTHFRVEKIGDLPEISERLGRELRSQYLLGYSPTNEARDGKYRQVKVDVAASEKTPLTLPLRILYRRGYYAPEQ
jgi:VWFA-related protein